MLLYWSSQALHARQGVRPPRLPSNRASSQLEQRARGSARGLDQRRRVDEEQQVEQSRDREHSSKLAWHRLEARRGLVEIHDLDDGEIIVGPYHAGDYADDGEGEKARLDCCEEYIELGKEACEGWNAGQRKQQHGQKERHRGFGACKPGEISDVLDHAPVAP